MSIAGKGSSYQSEMGKRENEQMRLSEKVSECVLLQTTNEETVILLFTDMTEEPFNLISVEGIICNTLL